MSNELNDLKLHKTDYEDKFLLTYKDNYAYVGNVIADIIVLKQKGLNNGNIKSEINLKYESDFSNEEIENTLIKDLSFIYKKNESKVKKIITILRPSWLPLEKMKSIISEKYFFYQFVFFFILNVIISAQNQSISITKYNGYIYFALLMFVLLFHETGHLIAANKFKAEPKSINFGIYFIFPVFYTNLSEIWKLSPNKRIIINLAGIYIQLIFGLIAFLFYLSTKEIIFYKLFSANYLIILLNLNPFLRFDGFWVFTDFFKENDLMGKSNSYFRSIFKGNENTEKYTPFLKIYTFFRIIFMVYIYSMIIYSLYLLFNSKMFDKTGSNLTIYNIFYFAIIFNYIFNFIINFLKRNKNEKIRN